MPEVGSLSLITLWEIKILSIVLQINTKNGGAGISNDFGKSARNTFWSQRIKLNDLGLG